MSEYSDLLTAGISDIRADIRDLHGVATHTMERVAVVEADIAEMKGQHRTRARRWRFVGGLVTLGAAIAKLVPGLHKG